MSVDRDLTKDFIKCLWRACDGKTVADAGVDSRDSTSFDKDLTRLRKGLGDDSAADLQGEEELELVDGGLTKGLSEGQEELAGGVELSWGWVEVEIIVMAGEGLGEGGESEGCTERVVEETGSTAAPEEVPTPVDSNDSSSFASKPMVTDWSSVPEASRP